MLLYEPVKEVARNNKMTQGIPNVQWVNMLFTSVFPRRWNPNNLLCGASAGRGAASGSAGMFGIAERGSPAARSHCHLLLSDRFPVLLTAGSLSIYPACISLESSAYECSRSQARS